MEELEDTRREQGAPSYGDAGGQRERRPDSPRGDTLSSMADRSAKGGGWIGLARVFLWIWFAFLCLTGLVAFVVGLATFEILQGLAALLVCAMTAFLSVTGGMVALDAAQNISRCAANSERILELLKEERRTKP